MYYTIFDNDNKIELNSINDIYNIKKPENVKELNLYWNNLTNIDKDIFSGLTQLQILNLYSNNLTNLNKDIFSGLTQLQELNFASNNLTNLDKDLFKYNTQLQKLYLWDNNLTNLDKNIFSGLTQLQELYLSRNNLTNLDKDLFKYNTQLQILSFSNNQLTNLDKDIFSGLTQLQKLSLDRNNLTPLDKDIFKYNTQLQVLFLGNTNLTYLDKELFKYNTLLQEFCLRNTNLTYLDKDLFKYNIELQYLNLSNNNLTYLDKDLFKYNIELQYLNLSNNNLTQLDKDIFKYNTQLQELDLSINKLTQLPSSITRCRNLEYIHYHDNPINYIPPHIQRFLNRLKQQYNHLQVYNDSQNVHNHSIQECIKTSLENILNVPKTINKDILIQNLLESKMNQKSIQLLLEYCQDTSVHTVLEVNFEEVLFHTLEFINLECSSNKNEIYSILDQEIQDSECKCFTGRISRLINCLNGFTDKVEIKIPDNMAISNIIVMIKQNFKGDTEEELKQEVKKELTERGYSNEIIEEYLEYVELD
jgi:Leucine-rich repeat (LRR) protein